MIVQTLIAEGASVDCQDSVSASTPSTLYHFLRCVHSAACHSLTPVPLSGALHDCGATFGIGHLLFSLTHIPTHSLSLVLVVTMRSKKFKTSRSILILICSDPLCAGLLFLTLTADVHAWQNGFTPLHLAAMFGREEVTTMLVKANATLGLLDAVFLTAQLNCGSMRLYLDV